MKCFERESNRDLTVARPIKETKKTLTEARLEPKKRTQKPRGKRDQPVTISQPSQQQQQCANDLAFRRNEQVQDLMRQMEGVELAKAKLAETKATLFQERANFENAPFGTLHWQQKLRQIKKIEQSLEGMQELINLHLRNGTYWLVNNSPPPQSAEATPETST